MTDEELARIVAEDERDLAIDWIKAKLVMPATQTISAFAC